MKNDLCSLVPLAVCLLWVCESGQAEIPTFAPRVALKAGPNPHAVIAADLDADGDLDLAASSFAPGFNLAVLRNNGDGTFEDAVLYASGGVSAASIDAGDLDGDLDLDLVVVNWESISLATLENNGNATFQPAIVQPILPPGYYPFDVTCADLSGDDIPDVAMARFDMTGSQGRITIFTNLGDGALLLTGEYTADTAPWRIASVDIDGDTDLDALTANTNHTVSVFENNGAGSVSAITSYPVGNGPRDALGADLDGDGDVDLVSANQGGQSASVLMKGGDPGFPPPVHYAAGIMPESVAAADLDLDGDMDLIIGDSYASDSISILENLGDGTFQLPLRIQVEGYLISVAAATLDEDVDFDIVVASLDADSIYILENLLCEAARGDVNSSGTITSSDIIYLVNHVFKAGPEPACNGASGDLECSGAITASDIIYLVNYVFKGGPDPC